MPVNNTSTIYRMGTAPNTRAVASQKVKIFGYAVGQNKMQHIGAVSEFGFDESRTIDAVRGVGFGDQIAELVPGATEPMTLTLNRTLLYVANIYQIAGYKGGVDGLVRSLKHHRWPFDLKQEMVFSEISSRDEVSGLPQAPKNATTQPNGIQNLATNSIKALFTYYEGCWFNSYSASFTADSNIVAENSSVTVTDIIDGTSIYGEWIDSGLSPISANGAAGAGYSLRFAGGVQPSTTVGV
jgi:hypothetical protein